MTDTGRIAPCPALSVTVIPVTVVPVAVIPVTVSTVPLWNR